MTFYRFITNSSNGQEIGNYEPTLEGTALRMKSLKSHIDGLSSRYEILMDEVSTIKEKQKEASTLYSELKKQLVELAVEDDSEETDE